MNQLRHQGERCPHCGVSSTAVAIEIADRIARRYGFDLHELRTPSRQRDRVTLRKLITATLRGAGFSFPVIASALNRDHSTLVKNQQRVDAATKTGFGSAIPGMPWNADHPWLTPPQPNQEAALAGSSSERKR